jgi:hypothetical protein
MLFFKKKAKVINIAPPEKNCGIYVDEDSRVYLNGVLVEEPCLECCDCSCEKTEENDENCVD